MPGAVQLFRDLPLARIARDHPINYADIGARGGLQDELHAIAFAVSAIGFEPDADAFQRLRAEPPGPWMSETYRQVGISTTGGKQQLFVPSDPQAATLRRRDPAIGARFHKPQFFDVARTEEVETVTIDAAVGEAGLGPIDFLKLDIEGVELDILKSAPADPANSADPPGPRMDELYIPLAANGRV